MNAFREFFKSVGMTSQGENNVEQAAVDSTGGSVEVGVKKEEAPKVTGKIIKVSEDGWGFIISQEIKFTRIFFHWTSLVHDTLKFPELKRGMQVEFVPVDKGDRGFHAIKVKVVEPAAH